MEHGTGRPRPPRQPKTAAENDANAVKRVGDKFAKEGKWCDARDEYARAICLVLEGSVPKEGWAWDLLPRLLCNRSIALFKCGVQYDHACLDALRAADALKVHLHSDAQPGGPGSSRAEQLKLLTKARFWEARALTRLDPPRLDEACDALRKALATCNTRGEDGKSDARAAHIELRDVASKLPLRFVCEHWADAVCEAESPSPFATSAREGRLLKPVQARRPTHVQTRAHSRAGRVRRRARTRVEGRDDRGVDRKRSNRGGGRRRPIQRLGGAFILFYFRMGN